MLQKSNKFDIGDFVLSKSGWQSSPLVKEHDLKKIERSAIPGALFLF